MRESGHPKTQKEYLQRLKDLNTTYEMHLRGIENIYAEICGLAQNYAEDPPKPKRFSSKKDLNDLVRQVRQLSKLVEEHADRVHYIQAQWDAEFSETLPPSRLTPTRFKHTHECIREVTRLIQAAELDRD